MNTTSENMSVSDTLNAANTLQAFVFEKTQKTNEVLVEAQRLINLYRQLDVLGSDFVPVFDRMLLSSKPDVQLALSGLSSGDMLRQYLKFLQSRLNQTAEVAHTENNSISEDAASYLPSPDEVPPFQMASTVVASGATPTVQPDMLSAVVKTMVDAQQKSLEQQTLFLKQALAEMHQTLSRETSESGTSTFDVAQFQQAQQKMINDTIERMSMAQAKLLSQSLADVVKSSQQIATDQVQKIGAMISANAVAGAAYPNVEEYVESVKAEKSVHLEPKQTDRNQQLPPSPPEIPDDIEILSGIDLSTDQL